MKKSLFFIIGIIAFMHNLNAQCTVTVSTYSSNFNSITNGVLPTCWTNPYATDIVVYNDGLGAGGSAGYIGVASSIGDPRHFIMPKVTNANGILSVSAKRVINANATTMEIGVMTDPAVASTFSTMATYNLGTTNYVTYNVNLSSYTGTGQYIAIKIYYSSYTVLDAPINAYIDNISYSAFSGTGTAIYVDKDATGLNNGTSWVNAYTDLNNALVNTTFNLDQEIWIAEGIYKPHSSDRNISFALPHNARIYGGFSGTETLKSQRDPSAHVVVLSGDLNDDDNLLLNAAEATRQDNSFHILTASGEKRDIIIDGVILSGANANGSSNNNTAGVILMTHVAANNIISVNFTDVIIEKNTASNAAIFQAIQFGAQGSTSILNLSRCTVKDNDGNGVLGNIQFVGHRTNNQKVYGSITNSLFYNNSNASGPAVIYNKVNNGSGVVTPVTVRNCTFSNNNGISGRVISVNNTPDSKYVNNIFYGNNSTTPIEWINSGVIASVFGNNISEDVTFGINQNPLFKDTSNHNYNLDCSGNSPAINAGNSAGISGLELDYSGSSRLVGAVDIGAYEYKNRLSISSTSSVVCMGSTVALTANNGTGLTWSNGVVNNVAFTPTTTQTYSVTGINDNSCVDQATVTITVETNPTITVNSGQICAGKSFTIMPNGASTYTVEGGSVIKTPTTNTTYTVIGASAAGCLSNTFAVSSITVNSNPTITVNSGSVCVGNSFTINPTGANTYTLQGGSAIVSPTANTSYTVIGTDNNGCVSQSFATSSITVASIPVIAAISSTICYGSSYTIVPSGAVTYTYSNGEIVSPTVNTTYTVTGTGANGCSNLNGTTFTITVKDPINDITSSAASTVLCSGQSTTLTTNSSEIGVNYYLRDDATDAIISGPVAGTGNSLSFNTGTLNTNATFNIYAEKYETNKYALDFDGVNDVINTTITNPITTNSLTIEAWIYPRAASYKRIISNFKNNATQSGEFIFDTYNPTNNGKGLRFYVEGAGNVTHTISVANSLTLNIWNHVAASFNNGVVKLYVNGVAVATNTAPFTSIPSCTNTISFGEDVTIGASEYFDGKLDEIRIWNTVRIQTEISSNMNNCLSGNEFGLRNYFKISENNGTTITDLVTGAIGTMSGMDPATDWVIGNVNCVTDMCGFEMTHKETINVSTCTNINSFSSISNFELKLYPNPNNGVFTVNVAEDLEIIIHNAIGQEVMRKRLFKGENEVDLLTEKEGLYFVNAIGNNYKSCTKIIINK